MTIYSTGHLGRIWGRLWILVFVAAGATGAMSMAAENEVEVTFMGGHEIGRNDFNRPVVLIAAALGVKPEVFREAFSGVTPAKGRGPTADEARKNKAALMKVLSTHGVTNERLDQVSDHYRYQPERKELWPTTPARAHAIVENGKVLRIVVTDPGSGYSSPPKATLKGFPNLALQTTLRFSSDLETNGSIAEVKLSPPLKHEESGRYAELASRPNPEGFVIAFMPALGSWLQRAEKLKGMDLSATEVSRIRDRAPAIAIRPDQVEVLRKDRGYDDVDPRRVHESWNEFKRSLKDPKKSESD